MEYKAYAVGKSQEPGPEPPQSYYGSCEMILKVWPWPGLELRFSTRGIAFLTPGAGRRIGWLTRCIGRFFQA